MWWQKDVGIKWKDTGWQPATNAKQWKETRLRWMWWLEWNNRCLQNHKSRHDSVQRTSTKFDWISHAKKHTQTHSHDIHTGYPWLQTAVYSFPSDMFWNRKPYFSGPNMLRYSYSSVLNEPEFIHCMPSTSDKPHDRIGEKNRTKTFIIKSGQ